MSLFGRNKVRVRFAPSPTGEMHLGSLRIALNNYLFAKHHGGDFLLRVEDTDQARFVPGAINNIVETLKWAGMDYDEGPTLSGDVMTDKGDHGPYLQSRRLDIYRKYADELVAKGHAYPCFCTAERLEQMRHDQELRKEPPRYDGRCRNLSPDEIAKRRALGLKEVIRLKMPQDGTSKFNDLVRGEIEFENKLIDDQVLMKSDGFPTYHLAVVVDDHLMEITHVIRGEEWISSTPKHLFLYSCFGWKPTEYAHMPLILKPGGGKLSKRDMATSAMGYIEMGYTKEALLNFVALLGWHPKGDKEQMTIEEMIQEFDLAQVGSAGAIFTTDKLDWLNGTFIRSLSAEEFARRARPYLEKAGVMTPGFPQDRFAAYAVLEQARIKKFTELPEAIGFMFKAPTPEKDKLAWKGQEASAAAERLESLASFIEGLDENDFEVRKLEEKVKAMIEGSGTKNGENLWPMRVALSGREASPGPFEIAAALGKEETLARVRKAIDILKA
jgi:nondiscriminating glutamyl-tRNA synthetase